MQKTTEVENRRMNSGKYNELDIEIAKQQRRCQRPK